MLTDIAIGYKNQNYIASRIFPDLPVAKQSGKHFVYDQGQFRLIETRRGQGGRSKEVSHNITTGSAYFAEDHALKEFVADEDVENNVQTRRDPFIDATENIQSMLDVAREKELADALSDTAVLTQNTTLSGTSQFSDYGNSSPFSVIETAKQTIHSNLFVAPNTMILGKQAWDKLKLHPALIERFKYTSDTPISPAQAASLFEVQNIIIAENGYNTSVEGQTDAMSYIWGKHIWLAYIETNPGPKTITLGFNYRWKSREVKRLRGVDEEDRQGTYVRVGKDYYDQKLVSATAGYLIKNAVA